MDDPPVELKASPVQLFAPPAARIVFGALSIGVAIGDSEPRWSFLLLGTVWLVLGVVHGRAALNSADEVVLRIGPDGITGRGGNQVQPWHGVALIWVGYLPRFGLFRRLLGPHVQVFTRAGVDFARRADLDLKPSASFGLPVQMPLDELCVTLSTFTDLPVVNGDEVSRWKAARRLLEDGF